MDGWKNANLKEIEYKQEQSDDIGAKGKLVFRKIISLTFCKTRTEK